MRRRHESLSRVPAAVTQTFGPFLFWRAAAGLKMFIADRLGGTARIFALRARISVPILSISTYISTTI